MRVSFIIQPNEEVIIVYKNINCLFIYVSDDVCVSKREREREREREKLRGKHLYEKYLQSQSETVKVDTMLRYISREPCVVVLLSQR